MSNTQLEELQTFLPKDPDLTEDFKQRYHETKIISVSDQINALQWSLRAWMAQRIVLLILTGVIGYALYYYFSHRPSEARNIFSALSKVNQTIRFLPSHISEEDESSDMTSEEKSTHSAHESSESYVPHSPTPPHPDEHLAGKPIQSLIDYPPQSLFDALEKTTAASCELWWSEDKKLIDDTVDYWNQHTPLSQVSQLLEDITPPMKKIYRLLALRYHPDKTQNPLSEPIFKEMTEHLLSIGERLSTVTKKKGLEKPSRAQTYSDILRGFEHLQREMKKRVDELRHLKKDTAELAKDYDFLLKEQQERERENEHQKQQLADISQVNERQKQQLADICQVNERQNQELANIGQSFARARQDLADIGQSFARARQELADIEKQMDENDETDKKMEEHHQYHAKKLARWQQKLRENDQCLRTIRNICFHAASLDPNHPLIDTYYARYLERKNEDNTLTPIGQIIMYVIGLEYFIRIDEPEQAQGMFDCIANFEGKAQLEGYQHLFKRAEETMKSLDTQLKEERSTVTPM